MNLTLHLTTGCSMRCDYCYSPPIERVDMDPKTALAAVDLALSDGKPSSSIVFFGGEPLLRKDLIALTVAYARERGDALGVRTHFKVTTNGLDLDDAFVAFCAAARVAVGLSLDGCAEAHDAHRRTADGGPTHGAVRSAATRLLEKLPYSLALMVVSPESAGALDRSVAELLDLGFRYAIVSLDYAAPWDLRALAALKTSYQALAEQYVARTRAEEKFYLSPFETRIASWVRPESCLEDRCHLGVRQISVGPDGTIYPCVQFVRAGPESAFAIGHVSRGIDLEARARLYAMSQCEPAACEGCAIRARCNHNCSCLAWQTTGSINGIPPILCEHSRMLLPIVDRAAATLFRLRSPMFIQKHYNAAYPLASLIEDLESGAATD